MNAVFLDCTYTHQECMEHATKMLGYENIKKCIPFALSEIKRALANGDEWLNTLDMKKWDYESGFVWSRTRNGESLAYRPETELVKLYRKVGLKSWSNSQGVSLLKHVARLWATESEV